MRSRAQAPSDLVAVEPGQAGVEDDRVGLELGREGERCPPPPDAAFGARAPQNRPSKPIEEAPTRSATPSAAAARLDPAAHNGIPTRARIPDWMSDW
jgi:hypothetical protein